MYILDLDPEVLFVIDRMNTVGDKSSARVIIENCLIMLTQAYENGKIIYLEPDVWYLSGGGLVSVSNVVEQVEAPSRMHPEADNGRQETVCGSLSDR